MIYRTKKGDVLDKICFDYYGNSQMLIQVLEANRHIAELPAILPANISIYLPEYTINNTPITIGLFV